MTCHHPAAGTAFVALIAMAAVACSGPRQQATSPHPTPTPSTPTSRGGRTPATTEAATSSTSPALAPVTDAATTTTRPDSRGSTTVASPGAQHAPSLYGVTVDDVSNLGPIVASLAHFARRPTTRVVFDVGASVADYATAISQLHGVSYLMGLLLDSSDEQHISAADEHTRVARYLAAFGNAIDIWEVGNEVNGNWLGPPSDVVAKLVDAYTQATALGKSTALTLYDNIGCGDGPSELGPLEFSARYVPANVRNGLTYVLVSYYEGACNGVRPDAASLTMLFEQLHALYPNALLGFGEIGLPAAVTPATVATARSVIAYYYGLRLPVPGYVGGYFWWYFAEDAAPYTTSPVWQALNAGFSRY